MPPAARTIAGLAAASFLFGCASAAPPLPRRRAPEAAPVAERDDPVRRLKELVLAESDPVMEKVLLDLLAAQTDGRSLAYLEAGRTAWLAERRDLARSLWETALETSPRLHRRIEIDRETVLSMSRLPSPAAGDEPGVAGGDRADFDEAVLAESGLGPASLMLFGGGWVLRVGSPEDAEALDQFLVGLERANGDLLLRVTIRILRARPGKRPPEAEAPAGALDAAAALRLARAFEGQEDSGIVTSPSFSTYPFQRGAVFVGSESAFVSDYEVRRGPKGWLADPVVKTYEEGIRLSIRCASLSRDRKICQVRAELAELSGPMLREEVTLWEDGPEVAIEIPEVARIEAESLYVQGPGEVRWIPVGTLPGGEEEGAWTYGILVEVEALPLEPEETPRKQPGGPVADRGTTRASRG